MDRDLIFDFIGNEGFRPSLDNDGDIKFKNQGDVIYIIFDGEDEDYLEISRKVYEQFSVGEDAIKLHAYEVMKIFKFGKVAVSFDEHTEDCLVSFSVEMCTDGEFFTEHMYRFLNLLKSMEKEFFKRTENGRVEEISRANIN